MPPEVSSIVGAGTIPAAIVATFYGLSYLLSKRKPREPLELPEVIAQRRDYRVFVQLYQVCVGIIDRFGHAPDLTDDERAVLREARDTLMR